MKRSFILLTSLLAAFGVTAACSVERSSSVLGPSAAAAAAGKTSTPSLLGTWVVQGTSTTASVTPASSASALPDFSSCGNFTWSVTSQTATEASGRFSAECATGLVLSGTITGKLGNPATIPIVVTGTLNRGAETCAFSLNGDGTPLDSVTFHITYSGTTCLGPLQGSNTLSLAPHTPAPNGFTLAGTITDGTSGGILPGITVSGGGVTVQSDGAGHYELTSLPGTAVTVTISAVGYITQSNTVTLGGNAVMDVVMPRVAPSAPAPAPIPSSGDQIDMHSVIVR
ncbi:MAG: hypothetical protein JWL71_845, partial [Acidobacteria bacterium]|nr:hypothetical protein [Acidobacteriota bacterium]